MTQILVVDNDGGTRITIKAILKVLGYSHTIEAVSGEKAVEVMNDKIGLITMDNAMETDDAGIKAVHEIRQKYLTVPIICISGSAESKMKQEIDQFKDICTENIFYIDKPVTKARIEKILEVLKLPKSNKHGLEGSDESNDNRKRLKQG